MNEPLLLSDSDFERQSKKDRAFWRVLSIRNFRSVKDFFALVPFLMKYPSLVYGSMLCFATYIAISISIPRFIGQFVDKIFADPLSFQGQFPLFVTLYVLKIAFDVTYKSLLLKLGEDVLVDLRKKVDFILTNLPMRFFDINSSGRIISRSVNDVTNLSMIFNHHIYMTVGELIQIFGSLTMMLVFFPKFGIWVTVLVFFLIYFMIKVSFPIARKLRKQRSFHSKINSFVSDSLNGIELIFSQGLTGLWNRDHKRLNRLYYLTNQRVIYLWSYFPSFHSVISGIAYAILVILIAQNLYAGVWTKGEVLSILFYLSLVLVPFHEISGRIQEFQNAMSSMTKIREILNLEEFVEETEGSVNPSSKSSQAGIEFQDFTFSYDKKNTIFNNLNLSIPKGKITAVIGRTGSGKTSLTNIICKLYPSYTGTVFLNGEDLGSLSKSEVAQKVGIVTQQLFLFSDTVRENIRLYDQKISDEVIKAVLEKIKLWDKVCFLENGLDEKISKENEVFSMGEKQLVIIARMLIRDPSILIFDEATSNLDNNSEYIVQSALQVLFPGRTTVIIAHRLSTIQMANNIVVLDKGRVVEQGHPDHLLKQDGPFSQYVALLENRS